MSTEVLFTLLTTIFAHRRSDVRRQSPGRGARRTKIESAPDGRRIPERKQFRTIRVPRACSLIRRAIDSLLAAGRRLGFAAPNPVASHPRCNLAFAPERRSPPSSHPVSKPTRFAQTGASHAGELSPTSVKHERTFLSVRKQIVGSDFRHVKEKTILFHTFPKDLQRKRGSTPSRRVRRGSRPADREQNNERLHTRFNSARAKPNGLDGPTRRA